MSEPDLMDIKTINSLRAVLAEGIHDLFDEFITDSLIALERLEKAIRDKNHTEINSVAHYLKGSGGNIGAIAFSNACNKLELQAINNRIEEPVAQLDYIKQLYNATVNYMKNLS
jgi:HPt (histidine-containing phosphotransfer) domain-containing protein